MNDAMPVPQPPDEQIPQHREREASVLKPEGLTWLLLDIEGTTCPVSFVADTLFPYASSHLQALLEEAADQPDVNALVTEVEAAWEQDLEPTAQQLRQHRQPDACGRGTLPYLLWLIKADRKLAPLKELQGLVWERGYSRGELSAPLFADVPDALKRWQAQGLHLAVYSSGSVAAQQLLYGHTEAGDLRPLFEHWFDTRYGSKRQPDSYRRIASVLNCEPRRILFISDVRAELEAAETAGLRVLFSRREGNPEQESGPYTAIDSYLNLQPVS